MDLKQVAHDVLITGCYRQRFIENNPNFVPERVYKIKKSATYIKKVNVNLR